VLGANVTDTVDAQPLQALVVEVRGTGGQLVSGAVVRFEAQPPTDTTRRNDIAVSLCPLNASTCNSDARNALRFVTDTSDAQGRAKVIVRLGHVLGQAVVRLTVPELGLVDSATFTVAPGAAAHVHIVAGDTALAIGATANLRGRVVDRYGNIRSEMTTLTAGPGKALTIDASTGVVTARDMGTQWVFIHFLQLPVDSTQVRVPPSGRLVVWSSYEAAVRLVNLDGSATRTIVTNIASDLGAFPRFNATRHSITVHDGSTYNGGPPNSVVVIDTTGSPRRDIGPAVGFALIVATRELVDGTLLVVGSTTAGAPCAGDALYRVAADNSLTCLVALPDLHDSYGGADISHDGNSVAYLGQTGATQSSSTPELRVLNVVTGATTVLEPNASSPRWSAKDDQLAYLTGGVPVIVNANGSGRRTLGNFVFSPGLAWSPDGTFIVGRNSASGAGLRVIRVSDGSNVLLHFPSPTVGTIDYYQPDWL
jgi:hypothetical protein